MSIDTAADRTPQNELSPGVSVREVKTDGFTMEYCRFGKGNKPFVILPGLSVQSVMGLSGMIVQAYKRLTDDYMVYVFDRRKELPPSYSVYDAARDTVLALKALGLRRVSLLGASYGGMTAMTAAADHPELVENLILASTAAAVTDDLFHTVEGLINLAKAGDAEALYLAFGEAIYPKEVFGQVRGALTDAAATVTEDELKRFITVSQGMKGFDVSDKLDGIKCPVLFMADKQDRVLGPAAAENMARLMQNRPDYEQYIYDGFGHAVYDTAPDIKERMLRFLCKHRGRD